MPLPVRASVSRQPDKSPMDDDIADMELLAAAKHMEEWSGERLKYIYFDDSQRHVI